jgi:hypothetical protein
VERVLLERRTTAEIRHLPRRHDSETVSTNVLVLDRPTREGQKRRKTGARAHVASKLLEAATNGETEVDDLKRIGRSALGSAPTMWC